MPDGSEGTTLLAAGHGPRITSNRKDTTGGMSPVIASKKRKEARREVLVALK